MRKFKNEQTGYIAIPTMANDKYKIESMPQYTLPKNLIENSKDWTEIFEPKFKNGNVVKLKNAIVLTDYEKGEGYGFVNGIWSINNWDFVGWDWQLATQEEWLEALTKEAVKRGLIKGNYALFGTSKHKRKIELTEYRLNEEGYLCNGTDILMKNGIWVAEVVKEETLEELADRFYNKYGFSPSDYKTFFNENKETIHRLTK